MISTFFIISPSLELVIPTHGSVIRFLKSELLNEVEGTTLDYVTE